MCISVIQDSATLIQLDCEFIVLAASFNFEVVFQVTSLLFTLLFSLLGSSVIPLIQC